jgi:hypothetical protein
MPDSATANFNLVKPEVNASRDTWGTKTNANMDTIDGVLKNLTDNKAVKGNETITGLWNFSGAMPTHLGNPLTTAATMTAAIAAATLALIPPGSIIMWTGAVGSIPAGWHLCDGTGGTPDLRNRFIMGAGAVATGTVGGAATHSHGTGSATDGFALGLSQIPGHVHGVTDTGHNHTLSDPGHNHTYNTPSTAGFSYNTGINDTPFRATALGSATTSTQGTGITISANVTGISIQSAGGDVGGAAIAHSHGIPGANHLPTYMALCFIMKL